MSSLVVVAFLGGLTLVILGGLIGHSLSQHLLEDRLREQAALQRRIGVRWRALRNSLPSRCPECGALRSFIDCGLDDEDPS